MMAISATLKMPVRRGPIPTFMKSITTPEVIRSKRLEAPPATNSATPSRARPGQRPRMATTATATKSNPFPTPKTAVRTAGGQSAPKLKKAPAFSSVLETKRVGEKRLTWRVRQRGRGDVLGHTIAADRDANRNEQDQPNADSSHLRKTCSPSTIVLSKHPEGKVVARDGIEPPTLRFSVACSTN